MSDQCVFWQTSEREQENQSKINVSAASFLNIPTLQYVQCHSA